MVKRSALVLDWDKVIFDTVPFKEYFEDACFSMGISRELFRQTYDKVKVLHGHYSFDWHTIYMSAASERKTSSLQEDLWKLLKNSGQSFILPDADRFLAEVRLKHAQTDLILLTRGEEMFQSAKLKIAGLHDGTFAEKFFVQNESKGSVLCALLNTYRELIYTDDTFGELKNAQEFVDGQNQEFNLRITYLWLDRNFDNMGQLMDPTITRIGKLTDIFKLLPPGGTHEV